MNTFTVRPVCCAILGLHHNRHNQGKLHIYLQISSPVDDKYKSHKSLICFDVSEGTMRVNDDIQSSIVRTGSAAFHPDRAELVETVSAL